MVTSRTHSLLAMEVQRARIACLCFCFFVYFTYLWGQNHSKALSYCYWSFVCLPMVLEIEFRALCMLGQGLLCRPAWSQSHNLSCPRLPSAGVLSLYHHYKSQTIVFSMRSINIFIYAKFSEASTLYIDVHPVH